MSIRPLPGYVLISPIEDEAKQGEVYLPESSKDKPSKGKIIDCALPLKDEEELIIKNLRIGQTVIYKKWTNQEAQDEGKTYLLVHFNELLGIVE